MAGGCARVKGARLLHAVLVGNTRACPTRMPCVAWLITYAVCVCAWDWGQVIGTLCKLLTVLINVSIWSKHASAVGQMFLFFSLLGAFFYRPAPKRHTAPVLPD